MIQTVGFAAGTGGLKVVDGPVVAQGKGVPKVFFSAEKEPKLLIWQCGPDVGRSFLSRKLNDALQARFSAADGVNELVMTCLLQIFVLHGNCAVVYSWQVEVSLVDVPSEIQSVSP